MIGHFIYLFPRQLGEKSRGVHKKPPNQKLFCTSVSRCPVSTIVLLFIFMTFIPLFRYLRTNTACQKDLGVLIHHPVLSSLPTKYRIELIYNPSVV